MIGPAPYVLLDDARSGGVSARLYRRPVRIVATHEPDEVPDAFDEVRRARAQGLHVAGYVAYDAAAAFRMAARAGTAPLLWFGVFDGYDTVDVPTLLPDPAGAWAGTPRPSIERETYDARLTRVLDLIAAGDIYQANLTFAASLAIIGDPLAVYARLRVQARASYGAVIDTGERRLLSLSPELFFALDGNKLTCRPMKGTARRGDTAAEDRALAAALAGDAKQRAENLMIVDLMRNDLARVAEPGSVNTPALFAVETYPTVHQMTSTVTARIAAGRDAADVIGALFPCGSITGAPKRRASEVIAEIEQRPRGAYCGAIGRIDPDGSALFNVAIRTIEMTSDGTATIGLGSGIVADSRGTDEWEECMAKGAFVTKGQRRFDLIETMRFDPEEGLALLERHLTRMKASADMFGFAFDRHAARNELQAATFRLRGAARVRLLLAASGRIAIEVSPPPAPASPVEVAVVPLPVRVDDFRLRHKTSDRAFYDDARVAAGTFEVVFEDERGLLTEGSFTSLFVRRGDILVTPRLGPGLPGVLRDQLLKTGRAVEGDLTREDLLEGFFVGNALRGLIPASLPL